MKRTLSILMALLLLWSLALPAAAAETATAATLRLEKAEGTVKVSNASGKSVTVTDGMRLYSGYTIATEKGSYAYVGLDSTKAVKLDASSKAEVQKSGKKLELKATAGNLFFNVTAPVEKDESLNIRTSTMVTGVRGTAGWVEAVDRFTSRVHLLEGALTVTSAEPVTGQIRQVVITGGQTATATLKGLAQAGSQMELTVTAVQEKQVPGFVAVEVAKDPVLQEKIAVKSPLSVPAIIGDAQERLKAEQTAADIAEKVIEERLEEIAADETEQVFTGQQETGGSSGSSSTPPDNGIRNLSDPTAAALTAALAGTGVTTVNVTNAGATNDLSTGSYTVASGQTLDIQSGTLTVGAGQTFTVDSGGTFSNAGTAVISGTATVNGEADNSGTITITSTNSLHVAGSLTNSGTIRVGTAAQPGLLDISGTLDSTGTITITGSASRVKNSGTFTNSGSFAVNGEGLFTSTGTFTDTRTDQLYAMARRSSGAVPYLGPASGLSWYADTTVTLLGGGIGALDGGTIAASNVTLDLNGHAVTASAPLNVQGGLTLRDSAGSGTLSATGNVIRVTGGSLTLESGTVSSQSGTAILVSSGSAAISGGTVEVTGEQPNGYAVSGTFTFTGGILRAKDSAHVTNMKAQLPAIGNSGDGWYTMDLGGEVINSSTLDDPTIEELTEALNIYDSVIVINASNTNDLSFSDDLPFTVPDGKALILRSGSMQVDGNSGLTVEGTMTAKAGTELTGSGTLTNKGTLELTGVTATCGLYNYKEMTLTDSSVTVSSGYAITNSASKTVIQGSSLIRSGDSDAIYNQNGAQLYVDGGRVEAPSGYAIRNADSNYSGDKVECYLGTAGAANVTITGLRGVWSELSTQSVTIGKSGSKYTVTIAGTEEGIHSKDASLTIHDGANISATGGDSIYSTGTLTMDGGTVSCAADGYSVIKAEGEVTISGGTVSATGTSTSGIYLDTGGSLNLSGGIIEAANENAAYALDGADDAGVTLTGGTVQARVDTSVYNADTITLTGYEPLASDDGWFVLVRAASSMDDLIKALADDNVTDVTFLGIDFPRTGVDFAIPDGKTVTIAKDYSLSVTSTISGPGTLINNGVLTLSGSGSLDSSLKFINNGTLNDERKTPAEEVMVTNSDSTLAYLGALAGMKWVDGGTVKLLSASNSTLNSTIPDGYAVTLDLNGQTVEPTGGTLTVGSGASLTILDSTAEDGIADGTLTSSSANGTILLVEKARFELSGGNVTNTVSGAAVEVNGGTLTMTGGQITSKTNGVNLTSGTLDMTGGTVTSDSTEKGTNFAVQIAGDTALFDFTDGTLRAKCEENICNMDFDIGTIIPPAENQDVYYTLTPAH